MVSDVTFAKETNLAQWEVVEEGRSAVRLPEGEGRGVAGDFKASPAVLGCDLGLEGPPVLWVRVQSLERRDTQRMFNLKNIYTSNIC